MNSNLDMIKSVTTNKLAIWKNVYGYAPDSVANKLNKAMLNWMCEMTNCLTIWYDKGLIMTDGELILARANLGALVECWLKFFYCVYYEDYSKSPRTNSHGNAIEPENLKFEQLKQFSREILWSQGDKWDIWVESIQLKRNAIHTFNYKDIGAPIDFINDIDKYLDYIKLIISRLPDDPEPFYG